MQMCEWALSVSLFTSAEDRERARKRVRRTRVSCCIYAASKCFFKWWCLHIFFCVVVRFVFRFHDFGVWCVVLICFVLFVLHIAVMFALKCSCSLPLFTPVKTIFEEGTNNESGRLWQAITTQRNRIFFIGHHASISQ